MYGEDVFAAEHPPAPVVAPSDYELERHKPMPSRIHGLIQSSINFQLTLHYNEKYQCLSELALDSRTERYSYPAAQRRNLFFQLRHTY